LSDDATSTRNLVLWPAVITLAVTLLRLTGELLHWSPTLFNPAAGGGGSLIGISWLPPVFGIWFAIQLVRMGRGPASGKNAVLRAFLGLAATAAFIFACVKLGFLGQGNFSFLGLVLFTVAIALGAAIAWSGWPALGRTMLAYAFAARIPVAVLMLIAMAANWGTHYDVVPPSFKDTSVLSKWFMFGAIPQLTTWIAFTVLTGGLTGAITGAIRSRRPAPVRATVTA
jgi:hypothetical protein